MLHEILQNFIQRIVFFVPQDIRDCMFKIYGFRINKSKILSHGSYHVFRLSTDTSQMLRELKRRDKWYFRETSCMIPE